MPIYICIATIVMLAPNATAQKYDPAGENLCLIEQKAAVQLSEPAQFYKDTNHPNSVRIKIQSSSSGQHFWSIRYKKNGEVVAYEEVSKSKFSADRSTAFGESFFIDHDGQLVWTILTFNQDKEGQHVPTNQLASGQCFKPD